MTTYKCNLKKHVDAEHEGITYLCDKCDYKVKGMDNIKMHVASQHKRVLYSCGKCDYETTCKLTIIQHYDIHKGICDKCDYKAKSKSNLKIHEDA